MNKLTHLRRFYESDENLNISDVGSSKNYSWECGNFTGKVKAKNIKDALIKSVKNFYNTRDYPSKNSIRLDIRVVEDRILCLFDVAKSVYIAPKGECDRKPEDVCKEREGCKYLENNYKFKT